MSEKNIRIASHQSKLYQKDDNVRLEGLLMNIADDVQDALNHLETEKPDYVNKVKALISSVGSALHGIRIELSYL